ncbi:MULTISPECIES: DUF1146 family protein [Tetragenococcus]|uniref:Uncharacterized DUF1146 family protein n=3 Tax=Tetragenococcus TaxID=51668 RepID=A0A091BXI8_9ENTE|nr:MULTISPECIES: DUF1146 family protein [Tetragenococcus]GMA46780.1 membrane protein [Tetragenococcus muriaticus]GMA54965.1 membrane protein [Alicyclobacillus contaminans]AYW46933.1 hypothetical protein C7K38_00245 [Tetragenococcus osmophilus]KFN90326.1 uncharacterized DUF1146 family protein [Tetragenococcus muriaticus 3MR10-3]KFN90684.1 uncharacterized DUF1146 family protein [Tetragenococcus muriaticus PMC-11-5]
MQVFGIDALIRLVSHFIFIYLAFWSLGALRIDAFFKSLHTAQIRMLITLLSIVLGFTASSFFLEIINLSKNLFLTFL